MDQLTKEQFLSILDKFQAGIATAEEIDFLNTYYQSFDFRAGLTTTLTDDERDTLKTELLDQLQFRLTPKSTTKHQIVRLKTYRQLASAAAILLITCTGILLAIHCSNTK